MRCFRSQHLLDDNTWSTRYIIPKIDHCSNSSTQGTLVGLYFNVENYGMNLFYDQINTPQEDIHFRNITIT